MVMLREWPRILHDHGLSEFFVSLAVFAQAGISNVLGHLCAKVMYKASGLIFFRNASAVHENFELCEPGFEIFVSIAIEAVRLFPEFLV